MTPVFAIVTGPEILIVGAIILVLFGADRLPKLARSLGQAKKEFESGMQGRSDQSSAQAAAPQAPAGTTTAQPPADAPASAPQSAAPSAPPSAPPSQS